MLQAINVFKSFGETGVLKGVSVRVSRGEVVAIIGRSGSGKSTLLRCMNNLETVDGGEIRIGGEALVSPGPDGKPVYKKDGELRALMLNMGMVFQDYNLFPHYSVLKNLTAPQMLVLKRSAKEAADKAMALLSKVGLAEKANEYPCNLSGGQCQRVAIARALCMDPEILCFDEPTSALDPELTQEVLSVIRDLAAEGHTMIVVTHEMSFAREVAGRILYMAEGEILCEGTPAQVFADARVRAFAGDDA